MKIKFIIYNMAKAYKTKNDLIKHLIDDKFITVCDDHIQIFDYERYGNIIDAYKDIISTGICRGKRIYPKGTSLSDFINLHLMDRAISRKVYSLVDEYEKRLKLFISEQICESMVQLGSDDCNDYVLLRRSFEEVAPVLSCFISGQYMYSKNEQNKLMLADNVTIENRNRLKDKLMSISSGSSQGELNYYSRDYFNNRHCLPFYILISNLPLSNLITIFEMFDEKIQYQFMQTVLKMNKITFSDIKSLSTKHNIIRVLRNVTHHHEPVIPFLVKKNDLFEFTSKNPQFNF